MAFTNTWDNTFPPDTQAANQLGQDLRSFRTDVQERMSAISGLDANKPSFEAGFAGVLYFATDTKKIYRWSGSTWVDVTSAFVVTIAAPIVLVATSTTPIFDCSLGSPLMATFEMTLTADVTSSTMANLNKGQIVTFILHQDGTGGHAFAWPGGVNDPGNIDSGWPASATGVQSFVVANDGVNLYPIGPLTQN